MTEADISILKARITEVVLRHLSEITLIDKDRIKLTDRVVQDLKADGDDLSFLFAPGVERDLQVVLTDKQWQEMRTVGDVIATFESVMSPPAVG